MGLHPSLLHCYSSKHRSLIGRSQSCPRLQFLTGAPSTSLLAAQASEAGPSGSHKRPRDDDFAAWLAGGCEEPEEGGACGAGSGGGDDDSGDECGEGGRKSGGGTRIGKKGKPMTQQALVKATREKARRERLNDWWVQGAWGGGLGLGLQAGMIGPSATSR